MEEFIIKLPYPPSVNKTYHRGSRWVYLDADVKVFRQEVWLAAREMPVFGSRKLKVELFLYPPSRRRFDIDNGVKAVFDALEGAKVFDNDFQIQKLYVEKCEVTPPGHCIVKITEV